MLKLVICFSEVSRVVIFDSAILLNEKSKEVAWEMVFPLSLKEQTREVQDFLASNSSKFRLQSQSIPR